MVSLAHPVDIALVRTPEDMRAFEYGSRLIVRLSSQILPKLSFTSDEVHYNIFLGTASCTVFCLRFNLSEPLSGVYGKDVAEVIRSEIHTTDKRDCYSFELISRDARGTHVCFGCSERYIRLCFLSYTGTAEASAQDLKPTVSIAKAFTRLLKMEQAESVTRLRAFAGEWVVSLCDSGLLSVWDLKRMSVLCEVEVFSHTYTKALLEVCHGPETLIAIGYPEEKTWVVVVYQLRDKSLSLLAEIPGLGEELLSLAMNDKGLFMLWKSGEGETRVGAMALDKGKIRLYTVQDERNMHDAIDACVTYEDIERRIMEPQRFSKQCLEQAARKINLQSAPFGVSHNNLQDVLKALNPAKSQLENSSDFLKMCKTVQSKVTECVESLCCSPESGEFPLIITYSGNAFGVLVHPNSVLEAESLRIGSAACRFMELTSSWSRELNQELKVLGLPRLTLALVLARMVRTHNLPVLPSCSFPQFSTAMKNLQNSAIPPSLRDLFLTCISPVTLQALESQIKVLSQLCAAPRFGADLRKTRWPAATLTLVSNSALRSINLMSQYALDCLVVAGWLNADTSFQNQVNLRVTDNVYISALETAARFHGLYISLSTAAQDLDNPEQTRALSVYGNPLNSLTALLINKPGRFLGSSDEFDPFVLDRWLLQVASRLLTYLTSAESEDTQIPKCCQSLIKAGQSHAVLSLLSTVPKSSVALEYIRGEGCALAGRDAEAKEAFCIGACLLDRKDDHQFSKAPWRAGALAHPGDSALFQYYKLVTRAVIKPDLKAEIAEATFWPPPADFMGEMDYWPHLFQVLVQLRKHEEAYALLVHYQDPRLPEFVEMWVKEMLQEGSIAPLHGLPLHPEILTCALEVLERLALEESFDLLSTLCSPRYRDQTTSMFLSTFGPDTRRQEASLTSHIALYNLALGFLQYRLAAKAMYHYYDNIEQFLKSAAYENRERWFILFLQKEALLLSVTALNSLPESQAWFVYEKTPSSAKPRDELNPTRDNGPAVRELMTREETLRRLCRIKRELEKIH